MPRPRPFNSFPVAALADKLKKEGKECILSILSQLLQRKSGVVTVSAVKRIFQFFPSCCRNIYQGPGSVYARMDFQFFPSCCGEKDGGLTGRKTGGAFGIQVGRVSASVR